MASDAIFANAILPSETDEAGNRTCPHCETINNEPSPGEMLLSVEFFVSPKHDLATTIFPCGNCGRFLKYEAVREHVTGECSEK